MACELHFVCDDNDPCTRDSCDVGGCSAITCTNERVTDDCVDLTFDGLCPNIEENPGGFLCLNDDDDNGDDSPDRNDAGATVGENDLKPLTIWADGSMEGTLTLSVETGANKIRIWQNADRSGLVTLPTQWPLFGTQKSFYVSLYVEGIATSAAARDVELKLSYDGLDGATCEDRVRLTVIRAEMNPVTSGIDPVPVNPAIVAPMTPLLLDDGTAFWDANTFGLTTLEPNVDLTDAPVEWWFIVTSGFITPSIAITVHSDRRSARLEIPFPSWGNLGAGRMEFRMGDSVCASVDTLIKNVQPDLEPGEFRFKVKAHLCHDGAGTGTTRTVAEVQTIMSDVTKVLSQCGIIVTLSSVVATQVDPSYINLDSTATFDMWRLFSTANSPNDIDVFFIKAIDFDSTQGCGQTSGLTGMPVSSGLLFNGGIAIPDSACDCSASGQEIVRTLAHELTHYLLNHDDSDVDHVIIQENLMLIGCDASKRDLSESQCIELRANATID